MKRLWTSLLFLAPALVLLAPLPSRAAIQQLSLSGLPASFSQSVELSCRNDPVNNSDPLGLALHIDGENIAGPEHGFYRVEAQDAVAKETMDVMIASAHDYKYSRNGFRHMVGYRNALIAAMQKVVRGNVAFLNDAGPYSADPRYWTSLDLGFPVSGGKQRRGDSKALFLTPEGRTHFSKAVAALTGSKGTRTAMDCWGAVNAAMIIAQYETQQGKAFKTSAMSAYNDEVVGGAYITQSPKYLETAGGTVMGDWMRTPELKAWLQRMGVEAGTEGDLLPGDIVVFPNFSDYVKRVNGPFMAVNAIYAGRGSFISFPTGSQTKSEVIDDLVGSYFGVTESESWMEKQLLDKIGPLPQIKLRGVP